MRAPARRSNVGEPWRFRADRRGSLPLKPGGRRDKETRQQRDIDFESIADFLESGKIGSIATVEDSAVARANDKSAKTAVLIGQKAGAPMMRRRERHFQRA